MHTCLHCGKSFETPKGETSDGCCSDTCWESIYAVGPQEEVLLEVEEAF